MVVHRGDLEERDRPAGPVIAPESNDGRRLLFLPSLEPRPVLFLEPEGRINIHRSISFFCACSVARLRNWTRTLSPISRSIDRKRFSNCTADDDGSAIAKTLTMNQTNQQGIAALSSDEPNHLVVAKTIDSAAIRGIRSSLGKSCCESVLPLS